MSNLKNIKQLRDSQSNPLSLNGHWEKDKWDLSNKFFDTYNVESVRKKKWRYMKFSSLPSGVKEETKYYFMEIVKSDKISVYTLYHYQSTFIEFGSFLDKYYPEVSSITKIDLKKALIQYKTFLTTNKHSKNKISRGLRFFEHLYTFISDVYDEEDIFKKDVWHSSKIPNVHLTKAQDHKNLVFTSIPKTFKQSVKDYMKFKLIKNTPTYCSKVLKGIEFFLIFINEKKPEWHTLKDLKRSDIEEYLTSYNAVRGHLKPNTRWREIQGVKNYIAYLQSRNDVLAPIHYFEKLILREDKPKLYDKTDDIKFIPEVILHQLEKLINTANTNPKELVPELPEHEYKYIPIITLLLATGWRINEIVLLRYNNCLVETTSGYYLQGDLSKTNIKNHKVPIDENIANLIKDCIEETINKSNEDNNKDKFLFFQERGQRKGLPISPNAVSKSLNRLAKLYNITDNNGNVYHFKNHAFRHSKGVELINNGMNLLHVQKWFGHSSPEMTLNYAKVADETLYKEWEKTQESKSKLVKVDFEKGGINELDDDTIEWEYIRESIEAVKVPLGYCMASKKEGCPYVITPCLTCHNFCTTPEHADEFQNEIKQVQAVINRTKDMPIYNEKNQKQLERLTTIYEQLQEGKVHHPLGKQAREHSKNKQHPSIL
ncbi:tyrosine-type recombinase/integrase [Oceanobacillus saliphilus]|uniref:tyrosine-type recombinase/integrase n=1 Tax=Oceanobacillus saliphilus TaxID=2925834 RepID=UPI00201D6335|nr:site-specific integrase [Oceanobacillus saliphilus]